MIIPFSVYDQSGLPLPGLAADLSFVTFKRINADSTTVSLISQAPTTFIDDGDGDYHAVGDDALVLPGSLIRYRIDLTVQASQRYEDGVIKAASEAAATQSLQVASSEVDFTMRQGDLGPAFEVVLRDERGARLVIAADAVVKFRMRPIGGLELQVDADATVVNGPKGRVKYEWQVDDSHASGLFNAEFSVTDHGTDVGLSVPRTLPTQRLYVIEILPSLHEPARAPTGLMALWLMNDVADVTTFKDELQRSPLQAQGTPPALVEGRGGAAAPLARDFVPEGVGSLLFGFGLGVVPDQQRQVFLGSAFSFSAWFRPVNRSGDEDERQTILAIGTGIADNALFYVVHNSRFHTIIAGNAPSGTTQVGVLADRTWTHLAVTFEPTSGPDGTFRLYQDGTKIAEETSWPAPTVDQPGAYWQLGASNPADPEDGLSGQLQDVRMYDKLLSDAEVLALAGRDE